MDDEATLKNALNKAYRLLSYRNQSRKELGQKLKKKGFNNNVIQQTITYLQERNYINDLEFARQWGQSKISHNSYGKYLIERELKQKGVDSNIVQEIIEELYSHTDELKIAEKLTLKKMKVYKNLDAETAKRRLGNLLQRKGFSSETVFKIMAKFLNG